MVKPRYLAGASKQRYEGPGLFADSYAIRKLPLLGSINPIITQRMRNMHGRHLAGLGETIAADDEYVSHSGNQLESQDDVFGSGIFDNSASRATANAEMGVFTSNYSLPGFIAREIPFTVSRDVSDITGAADVVVVPAGGFTFVEQAGRLTRPAITGPTWRPRKNLPAGVTARDQPYAFMTRPEQPVQPPLHPNAPVTDGPPSYGRPPREDKYYSLPVPDYSGGVAYQNALVPKSPAASPVGYRSEVEPQGAEIAISGLPQAVASRRTSPTAARQRASRFGRSRAPSLNVDFMTCPHCLPPVSAPRGAFGQDEGPSAAKLATAGVIAGVAMGLVVAAVRQGES